MIDVSVINEKIEGDINPLIQWARDINDKLRLHVDGDPCLMDIRLAQINSYENEDQHEARRKHAISNEFLTEELLRPTDNAFFAKGGSKNYIFKTGSEQRVIDFKRLISNVYNGLSLSEYCKNIWFDKYITDPNGLIFLKIPKEQELEEDSKPEFVYKSIYHIRDYEQDGQFIKWVIFEPKEKNIESPTGERKKILEFWVVDNFGYYKYIKDDEGVFLIEEIPHYFGKVPAILCSDLVDAKTGLKTSPIIKQIELLDKYLVTNSVLSIAEFSHNYPQQWMYVDECPTCEGEGTDSEGNTCASCGGNGKYKKDVANIHELRFPEEGDPQVAPPTGFVTLPTDSWKLMVESVDRYWDIIYFSHWGTTVEKHATNETATGRFLDAQPVNNRLKSYSKSIEKAHSLLADLLGIYYYPETFEKSEISYGDRYLIETPDQIWEKYITAKEKKAPVSQLNLLLYQFVESEFKDNPRMLDYELKKIKLEPFVHWDIETVRASTTITNFDKKKKEYFNEWLMLKSEEEIINTNIELLNTDLNKYVNEKQTELQ